VCGELPLEYMRTQGFINMSFDEDEVYRHPENGLKLFEIRATLARIERKVDQLMLDNDSVALQALTDAISANTAAIDRGNR
jgi:hypothetical protein